MLRELIHVATTQVTACMARNRVHPQERCIQAQDQGAHAKTYALARHSESHYSICGKHYVQQHSQKEKVPVDILDNQRKSGLAGVFLVAICHSASLGRVPERTVVRLPVVIARDPESQGHYQNHKRRRISPPMQVEAPMATRHATRTDTGRIERRDKVTMRPGPHIVIAILECSPRRIHDE